MMPHQSSISDFCWLYSLQISQTFTSSENVKISFLHFPHVIMLNVKSFIIESLREEFYGSNIPQGRQGSRQNISRSTYSSSQHPPDVFQQSKNCKILFFCAAVADTVLITQDSSSSYFRS